MLYHFDKPIPLKDLHVQSGNLLKVSGEDEPVTLTVQDDHAIGCTRSEDVSHSACRIYFKKHGVHLSSEYTVEEVIKRLERCNVDIKPQFNPEALTLFTDFELTPSWQTITEGAMEVFRDLNDLDVDTTNEDDYCFVPRVYVVNVGGKLFDRVYDDYDDFFKGCEFDCYEDVVKLLRFHNHRAEKFRFWEMKSGNETQQVITEVVVNASSS